MAKFKGTAAANTIYGTSSADTLDGGAGADTLIGGLGNDTYIIDTANDVIIETNGTAGGVDTVQTSAGIDASAADSPLRFIENFTLTGTGNIGVLGNSLNNKIIGNSGNNIIEAGLGKDTVYGGAGDDSIITFALALSTKIFYGEDGNDTMNGGYGVSSLFGGNGNDELTAGYGTQVLNGGNGDDTYNITIQGSVPSYAQKLKNTLSIIEASTAGSGIDEIILDASAGGDTTFKYTLPTNVEYIDASSTTSARNLVLTGNNLANILRGGGGNDTLNGGTGLETDYLYGGDGDDTYFIGNSLDDTVNEFFISSPSEQRGIDTIILSRTTGINTYFLDNNVENIILTNKIVYNIQGNILDNQITGNTANNALYGDDGNDQIIGGAGSDYLEGGAGADLLDGGLGADRYDGGLGDDTYVFDNVGDIIQTADLGGIDTIIASTGIITGAFNVLDLNITNHLAIENVTLTGKLNISVTGNNLGNNIFGNDGKNDIAGGSNDDFIDGGAGNDILTGRAGSDTLNGGLGMDTLNGSGDTGDAFVFDTALSTSNVDLIKSFNSDNNIILDSKIFTALAEAAGALDPLALAGFATVSGTATQGIGLYDIIVYNTTTQTLYYDADGGLGNGVSIAFAKFDLAVPVAIDASNFEVI